MQVVGQPPSECMQEPENCQNVSMYLEKTAISSSENGICICICSSHADWMRQNYLRCMQESRGLLHLLAVPREDSFQQH